MNLHIPKTLMNTKIIVLIVLWLFVYLCYYALHMGFQIELPKQDYIVDENGPFLIKTPGCIIPNYGKTLYIEEAPISKKTCGKRLIFVERHEDEKILFKIDRSLSKNNKCCYRFASPFRVSGDTDYRKISYSSCISFKNGTVVFLKEEIVTVTCKYLAKKVTYEDAYVVLKKKYLQSKNNSDSWNVLILGMDTMSRARAFDSMPLTVQYLKRNGWLDFRAYHKIGYNTFPNIAALLTGKTEHNIYKDCSTGLDNCNELYLWSIFQKAGYITAYGEDNLQLPDTFSRLNGYKNSPTNHYLRPLFLTGEKGVGNLVCTKKYPSVKHLLGYASNFASTYNYQGFFGFFWTNSYSHNLNNNPTLLEPDIIDFFRSLENTNVTARTFVLFISDHGIRFGTNRLSYESYFDSRLPMLFMWVPPKFRANYKNQFVNLQVNQNRILTPYDLYLTMLKVVEISNTSFESTQKSEGCAKCSNIFAKISPFRTCEDAGVNEKWCSCHSLAPVSSNNTNAQISLKSVMSYLNDYAKTIPTQNCSRCGTLTLKRVIRVHMYRNEHSDSTYYVVALECKILNSMFEATVVEHKSNFTVLPYIYPISVYSNIVSCVITHYHKPYCVCKKIKCK